MLPFSGYLTCVFPFLFPPDPLDPRFPFITFSPGRLYRSPGFFEREELKGREEEEEEEERKRRRKSPDSDMIKIRNLYHHPSSFSFFFFLLLLLLVIIILDHRVVGRKVGGTCWTDRGARGGWRGHLLLYVSEHLAFNYLTLSNSHPRFFSESGRDSEPLVVCSVACIVSQHIRTGLHTRTQP